MEKEKEPEKEEIKEKEESELEKEAEETPLEDSGEGLDDEEFIEFLSPSEQGFSSSLGQVGVATELRATDLERDLSQEPPNKGGVKSQNEFKYNVGSGQEEEAKYINSGNEIEQVNMPMHADISNLGKEQSFLPHEIGFNASPTAKIGDDKNIEKYVLPEKKDINQIGKGNMFEKPEVKYKPSI